MAAITPSAPPAPSNQTGQIAQQFPSYDAAQVIAAQEQSLQHYLNLPVREILARLGLPPTGDRPPGEERRPEEEKPGEQPPPDPQQGQGMPFDPMSLISPVTDALGTLGPGLFEGVDPTQMLAGISDAFGSTANPLQQSVASLDDAWQGAGGTAAGAKTAKAITNGAEVGAQSDALRNSLTTAATNVGQARARLIEIVAEFAATLAAIGPNIIFPWGWAAAIAAANKAVASAAEVMTELQSSLAAQAAEVTAAGAPVDVTAAPEAGAATQSGLAPQMMQMAMKGAQAGIQAGTGAASSASQAATKATDPAAKGIAPGAAGAPLAGAAKGGGGAGGGGGGGAGGGTPALRSAASPMVQAETAAPAQSAPARASAGAGGMGGAGMMGAPYAPMAGHGANSTSNSHTAASFLHTSDQGGEIVGDLGTAAPPVLGEADPNEPPDIELRI